MATLNLTQHDATPEQVREGVVDGIVDFKESLKKLLNFTSSELLGEGGVQERRAEVIAQIVEIETLRLRGEGIDIAGVMIGGMPSFMPHLEAVLHERGWRVGYAVADRESYERMVDGAVKKVSRFVHKGIHWTVAR